MARASSRLRQGIYLFHYADLAEYPSSKKRAIREGDEHKVGWGVYWIQENL